MANKNLKLTRKTFKTDAKSLAATIGGQLVAGTPKEFSTGSLGWNLTGKVMVEVGGELVQAQVTGNICIIGSKELAPDGQ